MTTIVQSNVADGSGSTFSCQYTNIQTAGHCNVIFIGWDSSTVGLAAVNPVVDNSGNAYQQVDIKAANGVTVAVYVATNIAAHAAGNQVTVTWTAAAGTGPEIWIFEVDTVSTGSVSVEVDQHNSASFVGTTAPTVALPATTNATDFLLAYTYVTGAVINNSQGAGWTQSGAISLYGQQTQFRSVAVTGNYTASCTCGGSNAGIVAIALKAPNQSVGIAVPFTVGP